MRQNYFLLPFNFLRLGHKEILVNELGDLIVAPEGTKLWSAPLTMRS